MENTHIPLLIFENEDFIIIDKPSGLVVHPFDYSTEYTLMDFLKEKYPNIFLIDNSVTLQDGRDISLGGIVHKLDRDTSGVMVIAKHIDSFNELRLQFRNHSTQKTYIARVEGVIEEDSFTIEAPLGRGKKDYKQTTELHRIRGEARSAITDVEVILRDVSTTHVRLMPKTGRTHQLRAHMSSIGHPILGDIAYGSSVSSKRIMLHAEKLSFVYRGDVFDFSVPFDDIFIL
ncbi:MAG: RluA family pseudouridine synthase [Candidatus Pacebacteria bacterium]|nr:RluA family pseudouridine synthase [Candidatus Paceibacterota bacterium]MBP9867038.1 RluA family pseudouridine synthase [Candidatus Paceibacterota bacterium]